MKCDVDICKNLYAVVVLSSSTTIFRGLRSTGRANYELPGRNIITSALNVSIALNYCSRQVTPLLLSVKGFFSSAPKEPTALAPSTMRSRWSLRFGMDWRICLVFPQLSADIDLEGRVRCILPRAPQFGNSAINMSEI